MPIGSEDAATAGRGDLPVPTLRLPELPAAAKLSPRLVELVETSPPERVVTVLADLPVQVDLETLGARMREGELLRGERAATVRAALLETAAREQAALEPLLAEWKGRGLVRSWRGVAIVNRLLIEARIDAIAELAASPALTRLADGERTRPLAGEIRPVSLARAAAGRASSDSSREPGRTNWALDALGIPALWKKGSDGRGVVVGILDSGVDGTHPQLAGNRRAVDGWFDPAEGRAEPWDSAGHGTAVLGCAVAGNLDRRRIGVAPRATWVAALANPNGLFHLARFTEAADWMLFTGRPDVLIMAFGFEPGRCDDSLRPFVETFRAAEIFTVFAAGNEGPEPGTDISPANYAGLAPDGGSAFAVGGVERDLLAYPKGGAGPPICGERVYPTVAAPAGGLPILVASPRRRYDWHHGTSYATGYAAGVAALAYQARPGLLVEELEEALAGTARDLGPAGPDDRYGHGLLDAEAALESLTAPRPAPR